MGLFCFRWVFVAVFGRSVALFGESVCVIYLLCNEFVFFPVGFCAVSASGGSVFFSVGQFSFHWVSFLSGSSFFFMVSQFSLLSFKNQALTLRWVYYSRIYFSNTKR